MKYLPAFACAALLACSARGQLFNFTTFAGSSGQGAVDGAGVSAKFASPGSVAMDPAGNLYVADAANDTIRKIAPGGTVSTFAGSTGVSGTNDGNNALFNSPQGVAADSSGNIYVADTGNFTIRKITSGGTVSTLAGSPEVSGSSDGTNSTALFFEPEGITVDGAGDLYVADTWNHTIRKVTPAGIVTTIAGYPGTFGSTNAIGTNALFYEPGGITVDSLGNLFVADTGNNDIREITSAGVVSTLAGYAGNFGNVDAAGTNASFYSPQGISIDGAGNLYVADSLNNTVRKVTSLGAVSTVAGAAGILGPVDGTNNTALFWGLQGILVNPTNNNQIFIADTGNSTIRQLAVSGANYVSSTLAGSASIGSTNATGTLARFNWPAFMAADSSGNIYVADAANDVIREITPSGVVSLLAGSPGIAGSSDGSSGASARFNSPQGVAVDGSGNVFVSDTGNSTIRKIASGGAVTTLAGSPGIFNYFDGTNSGAWFNTPQGIAVDDSGNVYVADSLNQTIRKVTSGGIVTTLAGYVGLVGSADGTNSVARFNRPTGLAIDGSGNLFVTDLFNHSIRRISPAGAVTTLAGYAGITGASDGANISALFFEPEGITVSGTNVYVTDAGNDSIRQLNLFGTNWVSGTIAGLADTSGSADGSGIGARFCYPAGVAVSGTNLLVVDSGNNTIRTGFMISNTPPVIFSQPLSQGVSVGNPVTFTVGATGIGPLNYQWQFNGSAIPGATNTSLYYTNVQVYNAGTYAVFISSATGSTLSSNAVLTIYSPPVITTQPVGLACLQGATVTFSVVAAPQPLTYQWQKNGAPIPGFPNINGANTATLTISNTTAADNGTYTVQVSDSYGSVTSAPAALTVFFVPPPDSIRPYAWWLLNEGAGSVAYDYSGNGHNGTLNTGATWTSSGQSGNGVYFNNTGPAQVIVRNPFIIAGNWTASMWVNRWHSNSASVLIGGTHDALKLEQYANTNHVGYTYYGINDYALNYVTPLNAWVHLVFVESATRGVTLYTNGVLATVNTQTNALDVTTLGCDNFTDYLDATLDDVRVYTNTLVASDVLNLYTYGRITPIPAVSLAAPANGASFTVGSNLNLSASVVANGQSVASVAFYSNGNLLGQVAGSPYQWTWTNVPTGSYLITAQAVYNSTNTVSSPTAGITVSPATNSPDLSFALNDGSLQISWPANHTGWSLQAQMNSTGAGLGTNWVTVAASSSTNQMTLPVNPANGSVFYRITYP